MTATFGPSDSTVKWKMFLSYRTTLLQGSLPPSGRKLLRHTRDFQAEDALQVVFESPTTETSVGTDAELVLYRALQEALSNAVRHGGCTRVHVTLSMETDHALLTVLDNGRGMPEDALQNLRSRGGLAGVRERVTAVRGDFDVRNGADGGALVRIQVPRV